MRIAHCGSLILLALALPAISAQPLPAAPAQISTSQQDALAAAARRAREQKKNQPKSAKVWDNDNIPTSGGITVIGNTAESVAPASSTERSPAANSKASSTKESAESAKKKNSDEEAQLKAAKENLKTAQTDLDFAQRKYRLDQQDFYQNPNYSSDTSGAAALQGEQNQIDAKKQAVQAAQEKVNGLESKLAKPSDASRDSSDNSAN
ncbi:MAG: hypothetical protein ACRD4R_11075 [Candidatus Acidiferrales bacterium]